MSLQSLLTPQDLAYIAHSGRDRAQVEQQLMRFQQDFPSLKLVQAVSPDNGMPQLDEARQAELIAICQPMRRRARGSNLLPPPGQRVRCSAICLLGGFEGPWNCVEVIAA